MIPIPSFLISPLAKLIGGLSAVLLVFGVYKYWEHSVFKQGENEMIAKYEKRAAEADRKAGSYLALKNHEIQRIQEQRKNAYIDMVTEYSNEIKSLHDRIDNTRSMSITAKKPEACRNSVQSEASNQQTDSQGRGEFFRVEIERETAEDIREIIKEVGIGEVSCKQLVEAIKQEFELK